MSFAVLSEYQDDLEAQVVQSMLYDADIEVEIEEERPRGMRAHLEVGAIRVCVPAKDLERARKLIRSGKGIMRINSVDDEIDE